MKTGRKIIVGAILSLAAFGSVGASVVVPAVTTATTASPPASFYHG